MRLSIKSFFSVLCFVYVVIFIMTITCWFYINSRYNWRGRYGQYYYMDNVDIKKFKEKYLSLCNPDRKNSKDYYIFRQSYKGRYLRMKYVDNQTDSTLWCNFFLSDRNAQVFFVVKKANPLIIKLYDYEKSFNGYNRKYIKPYRVNFGNTSFNEEKAILESFEQSVLNNIGSYERDRIFGRLCWYSGFFEKHVHYYCLFLLFVFILGIMLKKVGAGSSGSSCIAL